MTDKPELPLELLNSSIAHIEGLKAKTALLLGKDNLLTNAVITMDLCGHSYDYSEMVDMRESLIQAEQKMDDLEAQKCQAMSQVASKMNDKDFANIFCTIDTIAAAIIDNQRDD